MSYAFKNIWNKLIALTGKKTIEDSIRDGLTITATTTRIFHALKAANVKPPKASLDAMDVMKLAFGIVDSFLVKGYSIFKRWINE